MNETNLVTIINDSDSIISKLIRADSEFDKFDLCIANMLYNKNTLEFNNDEFNNDEFNNVIILNYSGLDEVNHNGFMETIKNLLKIEDIEILVKVPKDDEVNHMHKLATYGLIPREWGGSYDFFSDYEELVDQAWREYFYNFYTEPSKWKEGVWEDYIDNIYKEKSNV